MKIKKGKEIIAIIIMIILVLIIVGTIGTLIVNKKFDFYNIILIIGLAFGLSLLQEKKK